MAKVISCLFKHKFYDFVVTELSSDGEPLKIVDKSDPFAEKTAFFLGQLYIDGQAPQVLPQFDYDIVKQYITPVTGTYDELDVFLAELKKDSIFEVQVNETATKDNRRLIHETFKKNLKIETKAVNQNIQLVVHHNAYVPSPSERFLQFTLAKTGIDTGNAINELLRFLPHQSKLKRIDYCGLKDKRGVTVQRCCCFAIWPGFLLRAAQLFNKQAGGNVKIQVSDFEFTREKLALGDHGGNQFRIALRNVKLEDQEQLTQNLRENAVFLNKFGYQRFGTAAVPTDAIGGFLFKRDFRTAAIANLLNELAIKRLVNVEKQISEKAEIIGTLFTFLGEPENVKKLNRFTSILVGKLQLLKCSQEAVGELNEEPFIEYLKAMPMNMRTLFFHAFQSSIFNRQAAQITRKYLEVGDLVQTHDGIVLINSQNICEFEFRDLVLPLLGYETHQSEFLNATAFKQLIAEFPVEVPKDRDFLAPGGFRKVFAAAKKLQFAFVKHTEFSEEVVPHTFNDLQLQLSGIEEQQVATSGSGNYLSLVIQFELENSVYATEFIAAITGLVGGQLEQKALQDQLEE